MFHLAELNKTTTVGLLCKEYASDVLLFLEESLSFLYGDYVNDETVYESVYLKIFRQYDL